MPIKLQTLTGDLDRRILIALITSDVFSARVFSHVAECPYSDGWKSRIWEWCHEFYRKYQQAPGREIKSLYAAWARTGPDEMDQDIVLRILSSLSQSYETLPEELNVDFLLDEAQSRFNLLRYKKLVEDLESAVLGENPALAEESMNEFHSVELAGDSGISPLTDPALVQEAFLDAGVDLITWPGDLGEFCRGQFGRDCFVAFQGPEKVGKSWWLLEVMVKALEQKRRVAYFEAGDMSQNQILRRLYVRLCQKPDRAFLCGSIGIPSGMRRDRTKPLPEVDRDFVDIASPLHWEEGVARAAKLLSKWGWGEENPLRMSIHPNSTLTVKQVGSLLDTWSRQDGFVPDVVIVDYPDIMAPEDTRLEYRHRVNETWKALRRLSQKNHCLVVVVTQSDAAAYNVAVQTKSNFSEDKRKQAHVTGMIGINRTEEDLLAGLYRLNWLVMREGGLASGRCVHTASCLRIGQPAMLSIW